MEEWIDYLLMEMYEYFNQKNRKEEIPAPISEISMHTKLYLSSLINTHKEFQSLIDSFRKTFTKVISTKPDKLNLNSQKKINTEDALKFDDLDKKIYSFQDHLSELIRQI